jgi:N-acetyl-D-muramate 6-phosphate phosphatase
LKNIKAVLFDLDGTLVDTAPDVISTINSMLIQDNLNTLPPEKLKPLVSDGAKALLELAYGYCEEKLINRFRECYFKNITDKSCLFEGSKELLCFLEKKDIKYGVVTNKPEKLSTEILKRIKIYDRLSCLVCGDSLKEKKPHPAPLLYAARILKVNPLGCCYVGDHKNDIIAAKAAGMFSIAATYGYINSESKLELWKADYYINKIFDLNNLITNS